MDERIESFMELVRTLEGAPHVGEAVRVWLADYEDQFPDIGRAAYRQRVDEEIGRQTGTPMEHHLRAVLAAIDSGTSFPLK